MKDHMILQGVGLILKGLEVDPKDKNYLKTPHRYLETLKELFGKPEQFPPVFEEQYNEMVVMRGHTAWTMCPHHLLPVHLMIHIAYVPNGGVVGLSKLARISDSVLHKPILQEEATHEIADALANNIKPAPAGVACVIEGEHLCMKMRGVKSTGRVTTSAMRGVFFNQPATRQEFLALVNRNHG